MKSPQAGSPFVSGIAITTLLLFVGCGQALSAAPKLLKASRFLKGSSAVKGVSAIKTVGDDVARVADDGVNGGSNLALRQGIGLSARVALRLRTLYNQSLADHEKERSLYAAKAARLHPDDRAIMDQRLAEHDAVFRSLGPALQNEASLTETDGQQIEAFLTSFQTDTRELQTLLNRI